MLAFAPSDQPGTLTLAGLSDGSPLEGQYFSVTVSDPDGAPDNALYTFSSAGSRLQSGSYNMFYPAYDMAGQTVTVEVTYTDAAGHESTLTTTTGPIINVNGPGSLSVRGEGTEGYPLTVTVRDPDGDPTSATYTFSDYNTGEVLQAASATNIYTPGYNMGGRSVRIDASYVDAEGQPGSAWYNTGPLLDVDRAGTLTLAGLANGNAVEGTPIVATLTDPDGAGTNALYSFTIGATGQPLQISASNSYTPGYDTAGTLLDVAVSYTDGQGHSASATAPAGTIQNAAPLVVRVSGDFYDGAPQFIVKANGVQVGGVHTVTAVHGEGYEDIPIEGDFGSNPQSLSLHLVNDKYGGNPNLDRNLWVDNITFLGKVYEAEQAINTAGPNNATEAAVLGSAGGLTFDLRPPPPDKLVVWVSEDKYEGDAAFIVKVDGNQVGGVQTATTLHGSGAYQPITLYGNFGGAQSATIQFLNDKYGGPGPGLDRNLYVDKITLNDKTFQAEQATNTAGPSNATEAMLAGSAGGLTFDLRAPLDTLVVSVSEDRYLEDARFIVKVDGVQVGGIQTASTLHSSGGYQDIVLNGNFGSPHSVSVQLINDKYDGPGLDRNLYVDKITLNGVAFEGEQAVNTAGPTYATEAMVAGSAGALTFNLDADRLAGQEDVALQVSFATLLANDGGTSPKTIVSVQGASHGTVEIVDDNVVFHPAPDFSGKAAFTYTMEDGAGVLTTVPVTVAISPTSDVPSLNFASTVVAASEDSAGIALGISAATTDTDGSETLSVTIGGVEHGSLSAGSYDSGTGLWTVPVASLGSLAFVPEANWSGAVTFEVTALAKDGAAPAAANVQQLTINVAAAADAPNLTATDVTAEASADDIPLHLSLSLADPSETLGSVVISGVPGSYTLTAGSEQVEGSGIWIVPADQVATLALHPNEGASSRGLEPTIITVTATSQDGSSSATTQTTFTLEVTVPDSAATGAAFDGYIAGATVFADVNRNGLLDTGEKFTTTAADGTFVLLDAPAGAPLVMTGGTDVSTGLAFNGKMTAPPGSTVVTPLTSLIVQIAYGSDPQAPAPTQQQIDDAQAAVKLGLGLGEVDLTTYDAFKAVAEGGAGSADAAQILSAAIQVQTTIAQISAVTSDSGAAIDALASAVANAASANAPPIDLGSASVVEGVASDAGVSQTALSAVKDVVSAANTSIAAAIGEAGASGTDILTGFSKAATVALGATTDALTEAAKQADPTAALGTVKDNYTGEALATVVNDTPASVVTAPIIGSGGNDSLTGTTGNDAIDGLDGNDFIDAGAGNDQIFGGNGRDRIAGGPGSDLIDGGTSFDVAIYKEAASAIIVDLGAGKVSFSGSSDIDTLLALEGIRGTGFGDTFDAHAFAAIATAENPNAGGFGISIAGGFGPQNTFNEFEGGGGDDVIIGNGNTRISYLSAEAAVTVNLAEPTSGVAGSTGTARSSSGEAAGIGHDIIKGGVNAVRGSEFDDTLTGSANGNNTEQFDGGKGNDTIDGGTGFDRARYDTVALASGAGISVLLAQGIVTGPIEIGTDTLRSIESIRGTNNADTFDARGFAAAFDSANPSNLNFGLDQGSFNEFEALGGDDTIYGNGNTRLGYQNAGSAVTVDLKMPTAGKAGSTGLATGASIGTDTIYDGVNFVRGSIFNDTLLGSDLVSGDQFDGWAGDDLIDGRGGFDRARYDSNALGGTGVSLTSGVSIVLASGLVTGRDALATQVYGQDTLRSIEAVRGSNAADIFDARNFGVAGAANVGNNGNFNEFEGMGGDDQIFGNGNTRLNYANAAAAVTINLAAANPDIAGSSGTARSSGANDAAGIGLDTIMAGTNGGGISQVRGSQFGDTITGRGSNEIFTGAGGDDSINGGGGIDTAIFTGTRSQYNIAFDQAVAGNAVIADTVSGRDGTDTVTGTELLEFTDQIVKNQRVLDINGIGLTAGKSLVGGNNANGDDLTIGVNGNGRLIDLLGGGTDILKLGQAGTFYTLNLQNVEQLVSVLAASNDTVTLVKAVNGATAPGGLLVDLGGGTDALTLANGGNVVTIKNVETVTGGAGFDEVHLGSAGAVSVQNVETVIGSAGTDAVTVTAPFGATSLYATLDLAGGDDTVTLMPVAEAGLALTGVEHLVGMGAGTVSLANTATGMTIDLGLGFQTLYLGAGDNDVTVSNVENIYGFAGNDTVNFIKSAGIVNQSISLGGGTNALNLQGSDGEFSISVVGNNTTTVNGQTTALGGEHVTLQNVQNGTTYDLGAGTNDSVTLTSGAGFNVVSVKNVETVTGSANSDQIHVLGNSAAGATTAVKGGGGADLIWASADADTFVYRAFAESAPGAGRDTITDFNAASDHIDVHGLNVTSWTTSEVGGQTVLALYADGHAQPDMEIALVSHIGTVDASSFIF